MKILVCPLDWGLGHATRCVPLIRALMENHEVSIGAGGRGLAFLAGEFPDLDVFDFPGYRVRYSRFPLFFLPVMLMQAPALLSGLVKERRRLEALVAERNIDMVISDGRYGCRSDRVPSVLITHQIFIRVPGGAAARRLLFAFNASLLRRFREVWVPDVAGSPNLSGELGHGLHGLPHLRYIGPLSRFPAPPPRSQARGPELPSGPLILACVSGPEPQRTLFENALRRELAELPGTRVLVCGLPGEEEGLPVIESGRLNVFPHVDGVTMEALFRRADLVISRSGYTTLMEMAALGVAHAVLVPTPGQSEQEYLAEHLDKAAVAVRMLQDGLDLKAALRSRDRYRGFAFLPGAGSGRDTLKDFLGGHPLFAGKPKA
jgi:UDP:flavonoid glycosyltransferase YjiC (YdhE family)